MMCPIRGDGNFSPLEGLVAARNIGQNIAMALVVSPDHDNTGFICVLTGRRRRIDRNNDSRQVRCCSLSRGIDDAVAPQRAWGIFQKFSVQLLPAEACSLVFADYLVEKSRRQVCAILVGRSARHDDVSTLAS